MNFMWLTIGGALQTTATLKQYYATCFALVSIVILFGGLVAPAVSLAPFWVFHWNSLHDRYWSSTNIVYTNYCGFLSSSWSWSWGWAGRPMKTSFATCICRSSWGTAFEHFLVQVASDFARILKAWNIKSISWCHRVPLKENLSYVKSPNHHTLFTRERFRSLWTFSYNNLRNLHLLQFCTLILCEAKHRLQKTECH